VPVSAYAGILTPHTSTTGAERSARFVRTAGVGGQVPGRSCASSWGWLADPDAKISRQGTAAFVKRPGEHRRMTPSVSSWLMFLAVRSGHPYD
jgi:hypothetical protein